MALLPRMAPLRGWRGLAVCAWLLSCSVAPRTSPLLDQPGPKALAARAWLTPSAQKKSLAERIKARVTASKTERPVKLDVPASPDSFTFLTYNIAGLPEGLSKSRPSTNTAYIGPLLNRYDVVVTQEDFFYHQDLLASVTHAFIGAPRPWSLTSVGDGLSRFSRLPFNADHRTTWQRCSGTLSGASDCLASKGFTRARHQLTGGGAVDIYNLHMDAGGAQSDREARLAQLQQLAEAVERDSAGESVIIAGDTNLRGKLEERAYAGLLVRLGLRDVCLELRCPRPTCFDRVAYRGGQSLKLSALRWWVDDGFRDPQGNALSDHDPIAVTFKFEGSPGSNAASGTQIAVQRPSE